MKNSFKPKEKLKNLKSEKICGIDFTELIIILIEMPSSLLLLFSSLLTFLNF